MVSDIQRLVQCEKRLKAVLEDLPCCVMMQALSLNIEVLLCIVVISFMTYSGIAKGWGYESFPASFARATSALCVFVLVAALAPKMDVRVLRNLIKRPRCTLIYMQHHASMCHVSACHVDSFGVCRLVYFVGAVVTLEALFIAMRWRSHTCPHRHCRITTLLHGISSAAMFSVVPLFDSLSPRHVSKRLLRIMASLTAVRFRVFVPIGTLCCLVLTKTALRVCA